ncbi:MAG: aminotransferase class III-fold pyridoxal phosphate-dependent enzyme, partial [Flavobacterium sp.]
MEATTSICPTFSIEEAAIVLNDHWNINGSFKPLDSYLDQNFLVKTKEGKKYVLKIANEETPNNWLDLQNKVLLHLQSTQIPKIVALHSGSEMLFHSGHWWRVLEFLEGTMLSNVPFHSDTLLENIGIFAGNLSKKLSSFSHEAAERPIQWDLQLAPKFIKDWINFVEDPDAKEAIVILLSNIESKSASLASLRKSVIHADLTRYNMLLNNSGDQVQGLIDFGDVCWSWTIGEIAVLLLESVMTGTTTPFNDAHVVLRNYHKIAPITQDEVEILYFLIQLRSALIVCASARQLHLEPDNTYVRKQAIVDLNVFKDLSFEKNDFATNLFLEACGFYKTSEKMTSSTNLLLGNEINLPFIDVSPIATIYDDGACIDDTLCSNKIQKQLENGFGYTHYLTPTIKSLSQKGKASETILLGVCVFAPEKTTIFAPFDLIFEKQINDKYLFRCDSAYFTVYGIDSNFKEKESIKSGSILGTVSKENPLRNFPNHFFIQLDTAGTTSLFCDPSEVLGWTLTCQDPSFLLGIKNKTHEDNHETLATRRNTVIQQAQEYYYQKPMSLVRGWHQYLFDDNGQKYLDAINNVAHIGHSRSEITETATNQLKKLNTNARFLYKNNIEYAERLQKYFPKSLEVIFFACTGSEANDLALR